MFEKEATSESDEVEFGFRIFTEIKIFFLRSLFEEGTVTWFWAAAARVRLLLSELFERSQYLILNLTKS